MESADAVVQPEQSEEAQPSGMFVDEEGDWYHGGLKMTRRDIIGAFLEHIILDPDRGFMIEWTNGRFLLQAADTPFVIIRTDRNSAVSGSDEVTIWLKYSDRPEILDPATLYIGKENVLYCRIRGGIFPARFSRPAYYQLAEWIREDPRTGDFYLEVGGQRYLIRTA